MGDTIKAVASLVVPALDPKVFVATALTAAAVITGNPLLINAALSADAALLAGALAPGVPSPDAGKFSTRQPVPPCRSGFGRARLSGYFMLEEAEDNRLYQVLAVHQGRVDGYEQFYAHDDKITLVGDQVQNLNGAYGRIRIQSRLGQDVETAYASLVAEIPAIWTASHRGDGIASLYVRQQNGKLKDYNEQFPNGPAIISVVTRQQRVYDWRQAA